jgi:hypothetical protein
MSTKIPQSGSRRLVGNTGLARYVNKSTMCVWRWKRDPKLNCPPTYEINGVEYNDLDEWDDWFRDRIVNLIDADPKKPSRVERFAKSKAKRKVA